MSPSRRPVCTSLLLRCATQSKSRQDSHSRSYCAGAAFDKRSERDTTSKRHSWGMEVLSAARVLGGPQSATWVAIDDGLIAEVGSGDAPSGATDLGDGVLCPGFIDVQINGI